MGNGSRPSSKESAFEIIIPVRSDKKYKSKNVAVKEMKERIWKILIEKGHRENDEQVNGTSEKNRSIHQVFSLVL